MGLQCHFAGCIYLDIQIIWKCPIKIPRKGFLILPFKLFNLITFGCQIPLTVSDLTQKTHGKIYHNSMIIYYKILIAPITQTMFQKTYISNRLVIFKCSTSDKQIDTEISSYSYRARIKRSWCKMIRYCWLPLHIYWRKWNGNVGLNGFQSWIWFHLSDYVNS